MTAATTKIERSGPAIHTVLAELAPDECTQFETEFRQALARAETDSDLAAVEAVREHRTIDQLPGTRGRLRKRDPGSYHGTDQVNLVLVHQQCTRTPDQT